VQWVPPGRVWWSVEAADPTGNAICRLPEPEVTIAIVSSTRTHLPMAGWEPEPRFAVLSTRRVPIVQDESGDQSQLDDAQEILADARQRIAEVPAEVVVANHAMGLYELAAIHLSASPPDLGQAALAIDAVACLVEGLGDRLGEDAATLRDALANIRIAFVQIKGARSGPSETAPPDQPEP
jgi:hypothetical protein